MLKIDREKFYHNYRLLMGKLSQVKVDNLNFILNCMEIDNRLKEVTHMAYMLATVKHETGDTYAPIEEYGKGKKQPYGKQDETSGLIYYGRGYVQLTWKVNYKKLSDRIRLDLVSSPQLALVPAIAYTIMSIGMHEGMYTGKALKDYGPFNGNYDYLYARQIVNGLDRAPMIADYARKFEECIKSI